jgi:uncharacterized membrane protein YphA (DoxX/SURF4 family)
MFKKLFLMKFLPVKADAGLLVMRSILAVSLFVKHGIEKIFGFQSSIVHLASSGHYVRLIGPGPSLFCATVADGLLTVLLLLGLGTRWCAFLIFINLSTAWVVVGMPYAGHQVTGTAGEMIFAYIAGILCLALTGGGQYSIDTLLGK